MQNLESRNVGLKPTKNGHVAEQLNPPNGRGVEGNFNIVRLNLDASRNVELKLKSSSSLVVSIT